MKISSTPLAVLLTFAAAVLLLALFATIAIPVLAQSGGLSWEQVKGTLAAWATQMPLNEVATQAAVQNIQFPQPVYATAYAMLTQMPAEAVFGTLVAPNFMPPPTNVPPNQPTSVPPRQPTSVPPRQPTNVPQQPTIVVPTATPIPPSATPGIGQISGQVMYPPEIGRESSGIQLTLTRPDGSTISIPTGRNGTFMFSNMTVGPYTLEARAQGFLSAQVSFVLHTGEDRQLPPTVLVSGDTNGDNRIDLSDAALVASNFNRPAIVTEVDLNADGWIDIRDLTLIGAAFGFSGPLPWENG